MKHSTFRLIIDEHLRDEPEELRDYLKACYTSRSDFFTRCSPNEYSGDPTLLTKNKAILLKLFPALNIETADNIVNFYISFELEDLNQKKVKDILKKNKPKETIEKTFNPLKLAVKGKATMMLSQQREKDQKEVKSSSQTETARKAEANEGEVPKKGELI